MAVGVLGGGPILEGRYPIYVGHDARENADGQLRVPGLFIPDNGLSFVTDIAAITHYGFDLDTLHEGDYLTFKTEPDNPKDPKAVEVYLKIKNRIHQERS